MGMIDGQGPSLVGDETRAGALRAFQLFIFCFLHEMMVRVFWSNNGYN